MSDYSDKNFVKNWHQFKGGSPIVETGDSFITDRGKTLDVIQIYFEKETCKVYFWLTGSKTMSEESLYKLIKSKKYKLKPCRGFLNRLFVSRGEMFQNQDEVKAYLEEKANEERANNDADL